ncbi:hypothetical protein PG984_003478 [Apiospora sp. TS-2023a]
MQIKWGGGVDAEGAPVYWPEVPTLDVNCYWPIRYTPSTASLEERRRMWDLSDQICISADGCPAGAGKPHCAIKDDRPLGT